MRKVRIHRTKNFQYGFGYIYISINGEIIGKIKNGKSLDIKYSSDEDLNIQANFKLCKKTIFNIEKGTSDIDLIVAPIAYIFGTYVEIAKVNNEETLNIENDFNKIKLELTNKARNKMLITLVPTILLIWLYIFIFVI
ncbi:MULTISPECIES: hypothetical protein [Francisella]|uniref:hypothetical protein n=1 Tax=Francisella TaxID=262 RepID=UPI0011B5173B|nr:MULTISPECIES: hypothetical protein [Francisella]